MMITAALLIGDVEMYSNNAHVLSKFKYAISDDVFELEASSLMVCSVTQKAPSAVDS